MAVSRLCECVYGGGLRSYIMYVSIVPSAAASSASPPHTRIERHIMLKDWGSPFFVARQRALCLM
jgi:hypothetical protein